MHAFMIHACNCLHEMDEEKSSDSQQCLAVAPGPALSQSCVMHETNGHFSSGSCKSVWPKVIKKQQMARHRRRIYSNNKSITSQLPYRVHIRTTTRERRDFNLKSSTTNSNFILVALSIVLIYSVPIISKLATCYQYTSPSSSVLPPNNLSNQQQQQRRPGQMQDLANAQISSTFDFVNQLPTLTSETTSSLASSGIVGSEDQVDWANRLSVQPAASATINHDLYTADNDLAAQPIVSSKQQHQHQHQQSAEMPEQSPFIVHKQAPAYLPPILPKLANLFLPVNLMNSLPDQQQQQQQFQQPLAFKNLINSRLQTLSQLQPQQQLQQTHLGRAIEATRMFVRQQQALNANQNQLNHNQLASRAPLLSQLPGTVSNKLYNFLFQPRGQAGLLNQMAQPGTVSANGTSTFGAPLQPVGGQGTEATRKIYHNTSDTGLVGATGGQYNGTSGLPNELIQSASSDNQDTAISSTTQHRHRSATNSSEPGNIVTLSAPYEQRPHSAVVGHRKAPRTTTPTTVPIAHNKLVSLESSESGHHLVSRPSFEWHRVVNGSVAADESMQPVGTNETNMQTFDGQQEQNQTAFEQYAEKANQAEQEQQMFVVGASESEEAGQQGHEDQLGEQQQQQTSMAALDGGGGGGPEADPLTNVRELRAAEANWNKASLLHLQQQQQQQQQQAQQEADDSGEADGGVRQIVYVNNSTQQQQQQQGEEPELVSVNNLVSQQYGQHQTVRVEGSQGGESGADDDQSRDQDPGRVLLLNESTSVQASSDEAQDETPPNSSINYTMTAPPGYRLGNMTTTMLVPVNETDTLTGPNGSLSLSESSSSSFMSNLQSDDSSLAIQLPSQYDSVIRLPPDGHYDDYFKPNGNSLASPDQFSGATNSLFGPHHHHQAQHYDNNSAITDQEMLNLQYQTQNSTSYHQDTNSKRTPATLNLLYGQHQQYSDSSPPQLATNTTPLDYTVQYYMSQQPIKQQLGARGAPSEHALEFMATTNTSQQQGDNNYHFQPDQQEVPVHDLRFHKSKTNATRSVNEMKLTNNGPALSQRHQRHEAPMTSSRGMRTGDQQKLQLQLVDMNKTPGLDGNTLEEGHQMHSYEPAMFGSGPETTANLLNSEGQHEQHQHQLTATPMPPSGDLAVRSESTSSSSSKSGFEHDSGIQLIVANSGAYQDPATNEKLITYTSEGRNYTKAIGKPARNTFFNKDLNEIPASEKSVGSSSGSPITMSGSTSGGSSSSSSNSNGTKLILNQHQNGASGGGGPAGQAKLRSTRSPLVQARASKGQQSKQRDGGASGTSNDRLATLVRNKLDRPQTQQQQYRLPATAMPQLLVSTERGGTSDEGGGDQATADEDGNPQQTETGADEWPDQLTAYSRGTSLSGGQFGERQPLPVGRNQNKSVGTGSAARTDFYGPKTAAINHYTNNQRANGTDGKRMASDERSAVESTTRNSDDNNNSDKGNGSGNHRSQLDQPRAARNYRSKGAQLSQGPPKGQPTDNPSDRSISRNFKSSGKALRQQQTTRRPQVTEARFELKDLPLNPPTPVPSVAQSTAKSVAELPNRAKRLRDNQVDKNELMNELLSALDRVKAAIYKLQPLTAKMNAIYRKSVTSNTRNHIMDNNKGTYAKRYPPGDYDDAYDKMHASELIERQRDKAGGAGAGRGQLRSTRLRRNDRDTGRNATQRLRVPVELQANDSKVTAVYLPAPRGFNVTGNSNGTVQQMSSLSPSSLALDADELYAAAPADDSEPQVITDTGIGKRIGSLAAGPEPRLHGGRLSFSLPSGDKRILYDDDTDGESTSYELDDSIANSASFSLRQNDSTQTEPSSSIGAPQTDRSLDDEDVQNPLFGYRITIYQSPATESSGGGDSNTTDSATNSSSSSYPDQSQVLSYSLISDPDSQAGVSFVDLTGEGANQVGDTENDGNDEPITGPIGDTNPSVDQDQDNDDNDRDLMATSESSLSPTSRQTTTQTSTIGSPSLLVGNVTAGSVSGDLAGQASSSASTKKKKKYETSSKKEEKKHKKMGEEEEKHKKKDKKESGDKKGEKWSKHQQRGKKGEEVHKKKKEFKKIKHSKGVMSKESHKLHRDKHIKAHDRGAAKEKALKERTQIEFFEREQIVDDEFEKGKKSTMKAGWASGHDAKKVDKAMHGGHGGHGGGGGGGGGDFMSMGGSQQVKQVETPPPSMMMMAASEHGDTGYLEKGHGSSMETSTGKQSNKFEKKHMEAKGKKFKGWREKGYKIITETEFIDRGSLHDSAYKKRDKGAAHHQKLKKHEAKSEGHHGSMHEQHKKSHKEEEKKSKMEKKHKEVMDKEEGEKDKKQKKMHKKEMAEKKSKKHKHKQKDYHSDDDHNKEESAPTMASVLNEPDMQIGSTTLKPTNSPLQAQTSALIASQQQNRIQHPSANANDSVGANTNKRHILTAAAKLDSDIKTTGARSAAAPVDMKDYSNHRDKLQVASDKNKTRKEVELTGERARLEPVLEPGYADDTSPLLRLANNLFRSELGRQRNLAIVADRRTTGTGDSDESAKKLPPTKRPVEAYSTSTSPDLPTIGHSKSTHPESKGNFDDRFRREPAQLGQEHISEPLNRPLTYTNPTHVQTKQSLQNSEQPHHFDGPTTNRLFQVEQRTRAAPVKVAENGHPRQLFSSQPASPFKLELTRATQAQRHELAIVPQLYPPLANSLPADQQQNQHSLRLQQQQQQQQQHHPQQHTRPQQQHASAPFFELTNHYNSFDYDTDHLIRSALAPPPVVLSPPPPLTITAALLQNRIHHQPPIGTNF